MRQDLEAQTQMAARAVNDATAQREHLNQALRALQTKDAERCLREESARQQMNELGLQSATLVNQQAAFKSELFQGLTMGFELLRGRMLNQIKMLHGPAGAGTNKMLTPPRNAGGGGKSKFEGVSTLQGVAAGSSKVRGFFQEHGEDFDISGTVAAAEEATAKKTEEAMDTDESWDAGKANAELIGETFDLSNICNILATLHGKFALSVRF